MLLWEANICLEKLPAVIVRERDLDFPYCMVIVIAPERWVNSSGCTMGVPAINAIDVAINMQIMKSDAFLKLIFIPSFLNLQWAL
jgi:hypothetical protein